jgi:hypothetical protein
MNLTHYLTELKIIVNVKKINTRTPTQIPITAKIPSIKSLIELENNASMHNNIIQFILDPVQPEPLSNKYRRQLIHLSC